MPTSGEIVRAMKEKFPKFSRVCLCMARNKEYGVQFTPSAKKHYYAKFPEEKKPKKEQSKKRIVIYVDDKMYDDVKKKVEEMMDGLP